MKKLQHRQFNISNKISHTSEHHKLEKNNHTKREQDKKNHKLITTNILYFSFIENIYMFYTVAVNLFSVLFFYNHFQNAFLAVLPFGIGRILTGIVTIPLGNYFGKIGLKKVLYTCFSLMILSSIPMYFYSQTGEIIYAYGWFVFFFLVKLFFWIPDMMYVESLTDKELRGEQLSLKTYINILI